jgi:gliding motility-associated-like protein
MWSQNTIDLTCPFTLRFNVTFGSAGGADGMCFVLHNSSNTYIGPYPETVVGVANASEGGAFGYVGMNNSVAVEFDTYANSGSSSITGGQYGNDNSNSNHIAMFKNGSVLHGNATYQLAPPASATPSMNYISIPSMTNGLPHLVVFNWNPTTQIYTCTVDGANTLSATVNLAAIVGSTTCYYGFTSATGGLTNLTRVCPLTNSPTVLPAETVDGCPGGVHTLDATSLGLGTYSWSPTTNLTQISTGIVEVNPAGNQTYTLTFTDNCGFVKQKSFNITTNATPTLDLGLPISVCPGESVVITPTGTFDNLVWGDGSTGPTYSATGNMTVTATASLSGCASTVNDQVVITETSLGNYSAGTVNTGCLNPNFTIADAVATAGFTVSWSTTDGTIVSGGNSLTPTVSSSGTYVLTISGGTGCVATDQITLNLTPMPDVYLGNDTLLCNSPNLQLGLNSNFNSVLWEDNSTANTHTVNSTGIYSVTVDNNGCTDYDEIEVTFIQVNTPFAGNDSTICTSNLATLNGSMDDPNLLITWTTVDGSITLGDNTLQPTIDQSGSYLLTVHSPEGCTAQDQVTVTLVSNPTVSLGNNIQICPGGSFTINVPNPFSYDLITWGDGTTGSTFSGTGPQNIDVTVSIGLCTATDQLSVSLYTTPNWNLGNDLTVCGDAPFSYNTMQSVVWFDNTIGNTYLNPPNGYLHATYYYGNNCPIEDSVLITIVPPTEIDLGKDTTICDGTILTLDGGTVVTWQDNTQSITFNADQSGMYTAYFYDGYCTAFDTIYIQTHPLPFIQFPDTANHCLGEAITLITDGSNGDSFYWSTGESTPSITVSETGYYGVTITNTCGSYFDEILETFSECSAYAFIPNPFTPDQDGLNEAWVPVVHNTEYYEIFIFNRWGDLMFHSLDPKEAWDGDVHNQNDYFAQDGIYNYRLILKSPNSEIKEYFGNFHLVR